MPHTVWLLDVDGVLNASKAGWSAAPRSVWATANGQQWKLRYSPVALARVDAVNAMPGVDVLWATTWCGHADELHRVLPVGPFPTAFTDRPPHLVWDDLKVAAALTVLGAGQRLIWTDDQVVGPARDMYPAIAQAEAERRALLIAPSPARGLRPEHLDAIDEFARAANPATL